MMEEYLRNINETIAFEKILREQEFLTLENLVEFKFLESTSTLDHIRPPFPWTKPTTTSGELLLREIAVQTEIAEISSKAPTINFSSESLSLNDVIYRSSRFERFIVSSQERMKNISRRIKDGLSIVQGLCTGRKREKIRDIEMS